MTGMWILWLAVQGGQDATAPGEVRSYSTPTSIGFEWDIEGDANHSGVCKVKYRAAGGSDWRDALPLFRVDYRGWWLGGLKADRHYNMFAGSLLFLEPGAAYEVKLYLSDPDGGSATKTISIRTRALPQMPAGGRTLHAVPGSGGGDGSEGAPFQGLEAAQAAARPGDVVLLRRGSYGSFTFAKSGEPGRYLVWKAAGAGEAEFGAVDVSAGHVWLEGFTLKKESRDRGLVARGACKDVVVSRSAFTGYHDSILLSRECEGWTVADNVIVGDKEAPLSREQKDHTSGEGVELSKSSGHVVCHNRISRVADGVSYPLRNCDIFGNDIFDCSDDGIEPDYGYANNRMWGNRITNMYAYAFTFQPMYCGPWYFIRNQVVTASGVFKFNVEDCYVLANNTFVSWGGIRRGYMQEVLRTVSRNNLYITADDAPVWSARSHGKEFAEREIYAPNWQTDVDYDGFDWGNAARAFVWNGKAYKDLAGFAQAVGIEPRGRRVRKEEIFEGWDLPSKPVRVEPRTLTLRAESAAVDAGAALPNLVEDFAGKAPDLGACESGKPPPRYGPRP
jgi:hypothetical protein